MRIKLVQFLLWLRERVDALLERYDRCCYPGCKSQASRWCETGGHRHCDDHESGFYEDVDFCQSCYEEMTPEERQTEINEARAYQKEVFDDAD